MIKINVKTDVKATAVILGGTGLIGIYISKCFLTDYRTAFPIVRVTTRDVSSSKARELAALGAEVYSFDEPLAHVLSGADVVINALPTHISEEDKKKALTAVAASSPKVYFMSEFGVDYYLNDFPGYEHPEWPHKRAITADTYALMGDKVKIIALITGIFMGTITAASSTNIGLDVKNNTYTFFGSPETKWATTAEIDIARSIAQLSVLALDPVTAASVPSSMRIASVHTSHADIASTVARVRGVPKSEVLAEDLGMYKEWLSKNSSQSIFDYLKVLMGEGKLDWVAKNDNEFINPGESLWKWKTIEEEIRGAV